MFICYGVNLPSIPLGLLPRAYNHRYLLFKLNRRLPVIKINLIGVHPPIVDSDPLVPSSLGLDLSCDKPITVITILSGNQLAGLICSAAKIWFWKDISTDIGYLNNF